MTLMHTAAIFDMDGLLVDSEPYWERAEQDVFGQMGLELTPGMCALTRGRRIAEIAAYWYARRELPGDIATTAARLQARVTQLLSEHACAMPGVMAVLDLLRERGFTLGLASSSPRPIIDAVLERLGIGPRFAAVVSANDLDHGKPHPQVYLHCASLLGTEAARCIAFEDSVTGLLACKSASMAAVAVPDSAVFDDPRFSIADLKLPSLALLTPDHLRQLAV
ncbi:hexitol phosphatase HxpB [Paludibacterium yongneupense]|uniref:hexitol phosphatase HxpB n=1 Tax=Paludibacterium yongneupense TaxID=400061 RepID=UPI000686223C|nr:hexitol phosphatase HxpB [Paludibacterium yongneupense]